MSNLLFEAIRFKIPIPGRTPIGESQPFICSNIKSLEFVDDIADLNDDMISAQVSCKVMENMQDKKRLSFSAEKSELLRINPKPYSIGLA